MRVHSRSLAVPAVALLCALPAPSARASFQLLDEARSVSIEVVHTEDEFSSCIPFLDPLCQPDSSTSSTSGDDHSAPDPGPWSATASLPAFPGTWASQDSTIGADTIVASGSHAGVSSYSNSGGFPITLVSEDHASASVFSASFQLSEPRSFQLTGSVTTEGGFLSSSQAFVRLTGPGAAIVAELQVASDPGCVDPSCATIGPESVDAAGMLTPGSYTLEASAAGSAAGTHGPSGSFGSGQAGAFDLTLQLAPPPAVPALPAWVAALLAAGLAASARRVPRGPPRPGHTTRLS